MRRWSVLVAMALGLAMLTGCGSNSGSSGTAQLRLLNASVGYPSLDMQVNGVVQNGAVAYGTAGSYAGVTTDAISTSVAIAGQSTALATASRTLAKDSYYTMVAYGWPSAIKTALIQENVAAPASGNASLSVLNLAPDAGNVDVYLSTSGAADPNPFASATLVASNVAGGSGSGYNQVGAGTYRLLVTGNGNTNDVRLDTPGISLANGQVVTLIVTSTPSTDASGNYAGGVLVNAIGMLQQAPVSGAYANTQSRVRVVAAASNNAQVSATIGSTTVATNLISPNAYQNYAPLASSTQLPVSLSVNGKAVAVANQALLAGGDYTLLVYGDAANPQVHLIADDNRLPANTANAKMRLVNAMVGAAAVPVTLVSDIAGTVASSVPQGQASAFFANLPASTSVRLDVFSPLQAQPLVDLQNQNILAKGVYTLYVFGDPTTITPATPLPYTLLKQR